MFHSVANDYMACQHHHTVQYTKQINVLWSNILEHESMKIYAKFINQLETKGGLQSFAQLALLLTWRDQEKYIFLNNCILSWFSQSQSHHNVRNMHLITQSRASGIARPRSTRACSLPSTFQALLSPAKLELCDSVTNQTRKQINYSSCNASFSVCMQHIVKLSINTLRLTKYFRPLSAYKIFRIRCLTRCAFKFSKWRQQFLMKTIIINSIMDTRSELQYKLRHLESYNKAVFFLFQATLLYNGSWVRTGSLR